MTDELADTVQAGQSLAKHLSDLHSKWRKNQESDQVAIAYSNALGELLRINNMLLNNREDSREARDVVCALLVSAPLLHVQSIAKSELKEWGEAALATEYAQNASEVKATCLMILGLVEREVGNLEACLEFLQEARNIYAQLGKSVEAAGCQANVGIVFAKQGRFEGAAAELDDASTILSMSGDQRLMLKLLGSRSWVATRLKKYVEAKRFASEYLKTARDTNDLEEQVHALGQLGTCHRRLSEWASNSGMMFESQGYLEKAAEFYRQQKDAARTIRSRASERNALGNLGSIYSDLGRYDESEEYFEESIEMSVEDDDEQAVAVDRCNLGQVYLDSKRPEKARFPLQQALEFFQQQGDRIRLAVVLWNLALVSEQLGDLPSAVANAEDSLQLRKGTNDYRVSEIRACILEWEQQL